MKTKTLLKLEEALFFLKQMEENIKNDPDFDYFFNAFLSSSRSVTFILKKEYSKFDGFKNWYEQKVLNEKENLILKKLTVDLRNTSVHVKSLKTELEYVLKIPDILNIDKDGDYRIVVKKSRQKKLKKKENIIKYNEEAQGIGFTSRVDVIRVLKASEEIKSIDGTELDKDTKIKKKKKVVEFSARPKVLNDIENNVLYLCWYYFEWLYDIVKECEKHFNILNI